MKIKSFTKKAFCVALLASASVGANAADHPLGAISIGVPTSFSAQIPATGLSTDTFLFTLPTNGGSGYDLIDIPLNLGSLGTLHTTFTGMFLTWAGPNGVVGGGDDVFIKSSASPSPAHLTMQVTPSDSTFAIAAAGGNFYLDVVARGDGSLGGVYSGSIGVSAPPVPEPETYAMFLAGLGLMGVIVRRRMRSQS